jgi:hypothetical protein
VLAEQLITKSLSASLVHVRLLWMMLLKEARQDQRVSGLVHGMLGGNGKESNLTEIRLEYIKPVGVILFVGKEQPSTIAARSKSRSVFARSNRGSWLRVSLKAWM